MRLNRAHAIEQCISNHCFEKSAQLRLNLGPDGNVHVIPEIRILNHEPLGPTSAMIDDAMLHPLNIQNVRDQSHHARTTEACPPGVTVESAPANDRHIPRCFQPTTSV
ncbi:MAG: hypothetical protein M2R45_02463 [Verrucomicrobia subdivision 3 bacterium]|nr:hypothetical protein [Limisphaerales bacterium]MCS1413251.1 hypothetical protein [Limisphaerales bacterium]